jgi:hypothetical protein
MKTNTLVLVAAAFTGLYFAEPYANGQTEGAFREFIRTTTDSNFKSRKQRWYVWDDQPQRKLEASWEGGFNARPAPEGTGILKWRRPGTNEWSPAGVVRCYVGEMKDGKREGQGTLLPESGAKFHGSWKNDMREGEGRYFYANGDYYEGTFHLGKMHGQGTYSSASGEIYKGGFKEDERHGSGTTVLANGQSYQSEWNLGVEAPGSKARRSALGGAQSQTTGLRLLAVASPGRHEALRRQNLDLADELITYRSHVWNDEIQVEPESKSLEFWKQHGWLKGEFGVGSGATMLDVSLFNDRGKEINVAGAALEVEQSKTDNEPLIEVRPWTYQGEGYLDCGGMMDIVLVNLGWGSARNCVIEYNLSLKGVAGLKDRYAFTRKLGDLKEMARLSFKEDFRSLGVDVAVIERAFEDKTKEIVTKSNAGKILGRFAQFDKAGLWLSSHASLEARMSYEWTDVEGKVRSTITSFQVEVLLDPRPLPEGGAPDRLDGTYNLLLEVEKDQYRVPFAFTKKIAPGASSRVALNLSAPRSSYHRFRIVLTLSDGSTISTLPCKLHYFMPRLNAQKFIESNKAKS